MKKIIFSCIFSMLLFGCSSDDDGNSEMQQEPEITINVLSFVYIPPADILPERLVYDIEITNISNVDAQGGLEVTINADGLLNTSIPSSNSQCHQIPANTSCIYSFDETGDINIGGSNNVTFVEAEYIFF